MERRSGLKKKLAHVIHLDGPGGGPKTVFSHVSYYSHFFDVTVYHGGTGTLADGCRSLGVSHQKVPIDRSIHLPFGAIKLWWKLVRNRPHLLVLHGQWAGPLGIIVGRLAGVRKTLYIAQWPAFYTDWDLRRVIRNFLSEWLPCRFADAVIAISPGNLYQFQIRYPKSHARLHYLSNSFDPLNVPSEKDVQEIRDKEGWNPDVCHVVSVGRISSQKRLDWLLRAWKLVEQTSPQARLWIVGNGELEKSMRELAQELNLKTCFFLGSKPNAWRYIAAADIVAMTSMYEGHANVPLEAMSSGRPIVACKVDGVRESLTDGTEGFLVPPGDIAAMADRLSALISSHSLRSSMGQAGLQKSLQFHRGPVLKKYLGLLEGLLSENR